MYASRPKDNRASEALVRKRINYHRLAKIRLTQQREEIKQKIGEIVNEEDICAAVQRRYTRINGQLKDKHRRKLKSLICQKESNPVDPRKTVIHLSKKNDLSGKWTASKKITSNCGSVVEVWKCLELEDMKVRIEKDKENYT
ncbi:hypothetical protein Trydic_g1184 [Trypoxylus dichotomus]